MNYFTTEEARAQAGGQGRSFIQKSPRNLGKNTFLDVFCLAFYNLLTPYPLDVSWFSPLHAAQLIAQMVGMKY